MTIPTTASSTWTLAQIVAILVGEIPELTQAQISALSSTQLSYFSTAQVQALTAAQLGFVTTTAITGLSVSALSPNKIVALSASQLLALSPVQVRSLSVAQVSALVSSTSLSSFWSQVSATWLNSLAPAAVGTLSAARLNVVADTALSGLNPAIVSEISASAMAGLSAGKLNVLLSTQVGAFTGAQSAALSIVAVGGVSSFFLQHLSATATAALRALQIAAISTGAIPGLTIKSLSATQTAALTASQLTALSTTQVGQLNATQAASITTNFWSQPQLPAGWLNSLTATAVGGLTTTEIGAFSAFTWGSVPSAFIREISPIAIAGLSVNQLLSLPQPAIGGLTAQQIIAISAADASNFWSQVSASWLNNLKSGAGGLTSDDLSDVLPKVITLLNQDFISHIPAAALAGLTAKEIGDLTSIQISSLTQAQVAALSSSANLSNFWPIVSDDWLNALSPSGIQGLSTSVIAQLPDAAIMSFTQLSFLAPAQVAAITPSQTAYLMWTQLAFNNRPTFLGELSSPSSLNQAVVSNLSAADLVDIPYATFATFDALWLNDLPDGALNMLTRDQIQAILPQYFGYLNANTIGALSATEAGYLMPSQVQAFTAADFAAMAASPNSALLSLTNDAVAGLAPSQLAAIDVNQYFSSTQIGYSVALQTAAVANWTTKNIENAITNGDLTAAEIQALSPEQLEALSGQDIGELSSNQLLEMTGQQLSAIYPNLPDEPTVLFDIAAIEDTPAQIGQLASGWSEAVGAGNITDSAIWSQLSREQVSALVDDDTALIFTQVVDDLVGGTKYHIAAAATAFDDFLSLPDAAFGGLGQGAQYTDWFGAQPHGDDDWSASLQTYLLASIVLESYIQKKPLSAGEIDSIAPSSWQTALNTLTDDAYAAYLGTSLYNYAPAMDAAVAYFDDNATQAALFGYQLNRGGASAFDNWLSSHSVSALLPDQLAQLSAALVQTLSVAQLASLSPDQFGAIYANLTVAQAQGLLVVEFGALPASAQTSFDNSDYLQNTDIQTLLKPSATDGQLFSSAFSTGDQTVAQNLIAIYDQNYVQINANPNQFKEFTHLYNLLEARDTALISDSVETSQIAADAQSILNNFDLYNTALANAAPPATGSDVTAYVQEIHDSLSNVQGGIVALQSLLSGLQAIENNVGTLVLDNTTEATPLVSLVQWALNGAPNASVPTGQGDLSYNGSTGLTFETALENVEDQLFTNADTFAKNAETGINIVVANAQAAQTYAVVTDVLDVVSAVASLGAGIGSLVSAFSDVAQTAEAAASSSIAIENSLNGVQPALTSSALVQRVAAVVGEISGGVSLSDDFFKSFDNTTSDGVYTNLSSAAGALDSVIYNLTSDLTSDDAVATDARTKADAFATDFSTLVADLEKAGKKTPTTIGELSVDSGSNTGDNQSSTLVNADKSAGQSSDNYYWDGRNDNTSNFATDVAVSYTTSTGQTQVVALNLQQLFGTSMEDQLKQADKTIYDSSNAFTFADISANMTLPGFDSAEVDVRIENGDANAPFGQFVWQVVGVGIKGYNPSF